MDKGMCVASRRMDVLVHLPSQGRKGGKAVKGIKANMKRRVQKGICWGLSPQHCAFPALPT